MTILLWVASVVLVSVIVGICQGLAKSPGSERGIRWTLGIGVIILAGMWWSYSSWKNDPAREIELQVKDCGDTTMAFVMSQNFVKQRLKSPATADFPYTSSQGVTIIPDGNCNFLVSAYVDAQNGFGAMLRSYYETTMTYDRKTKLWRSLELQIK